MATDHPFIGAVAMRKIVFAVLVIVISASIVQAQADIGPAVVSLVRKSLKDNYRPLGTVKARLRLETKTILSVDAPSAKDARQPDKADVNTGRLQVAPANAIAPPAIQWTAELGPNTERFQVETPAGPQVFSMDDNGATVYTPAQKRAQIMPWMPERLRGQLQYDPREIGLLTLGERFEEILAGDIRSAKLVPRPEGETTAVLQAYSAVQRCQMVIECSSRFNYLPTRVYYISDAGYINGVTDITYQQVRNEP
jgi:hypothetical protein